MTITDTEAGSLLLTVLETVAVIREGQIMIDEK
jgi:hypothetical protein